MMIELKRILVPLDGSSLAETALPMAVSLAQKYESQILLLRAAEQTSAVVHATQPDTLKLLQETQGKLRGEATQYLEEQQQLVHQQGCHVTILLAEGEPAASILDTAKEQAIDLIVMSTHGRGGVARWTAGSVADKVVRHSPCPVLLVRQGAEKTSPEPTAA